MFWLFDGFARRFNEQAADYAAAQAQVLKRSFGAWRDLAATAQPVPIESAAERTRRLRRLAMQKAASRAR